MAGIPIERKGGIPWWAWLLGLLALLLLFGLLMRGCGDRAVVGNDNDANGNRAAYGGGANANNSNRTASGDGVNSSNLNGAAGNANAAGGTNTNGQNSAQVNVEGGPLTDIARFVSATDKASFVGRSAQLTGVEVQRVLSDRAFTVGPRRGQELYVILDDKLNAGAAEKKVAVKPGQKLTLSGPLTKPPTGEIAAEQNKPGALKLSAAEASEMKQQQVYLHADQLKAAQ